MIKNTKDSKKISYTAKKTWRAHLEDVTVDKQELYQHFFFDEEMQLMSGRCPV